MYDVIRMWKDEDYRDEVGADSGAHPAGSTDLTPARPSAYEPDVYPSRTETPGVSVCAISACADICSATTCIEAVRSVIWDDPVLTGI
jgi:mersacidin/lichenicidin family type 2 lantibiotic